MQSRFITNTASGVARKKCRETQYAPISAVCSSGVLDASRPGECIPPEAAEADIRMTYDGLCMSGDTPHLACKDQYPQHDSVFYTRDHGCAVKMDDGGMRSGGAHGASAPPIPRAGRPGTRFQPPSYMRPSPAGFLAPPVVRQFRQFPSVLLSLAAAAHLGLAIWAAVEPKDWATPRVVGFGRLVKTNSTTFTPLSTDAAEELGCDVDGVACRYEAATAAMTGTLSVRWMVFGFHMLSFGFEVAQVALWHLSSWFRSSVCRGVNLLRWAEYAFSAPLMILIIQNLSGSFDVPLQLAISALTAATMVFGALTEIAAYVEDRTAQAIMNCAPAAVCTAAELDEAWLVPVNQGAWAGKVLAHAGGWVCQAVGVWPALFLILNAALQDGAIPAEVRTAVIAAYTAVCVLFCSFGIWQLIGVFAIRATPRTSELVYAALSLAAKATLGILLFTGIINRPDLVDISAESYSRPFYHCT